MKAYLNLSSRVLLVAVCGFALWKSIRHARAEQAASYDTVPALARAIQIEPQDYSLLARAALLRSESGDESAAADENLRRAARLNPLNSEVLMNLALREELTGDLAQAERDLIRATELNHAFKASWALASFCYRTNQPAKFWPLAQRCLSLEPLLFDPAPVFDLCWQMSADAKKIAAILPRTGPLPVAYLGYLMGTRRVQAAIEFWPSLLQVLDRSVPRTTETALSYCEFLARNGRPEEAVHAWNQLIDRGIVHSGRLDPAAGISIADPDFTSGESGGVFNWQFFKPDGVFVATGRAGVSFEFDGNETQAIQLLSTSAPVMPGRAYQLKWKKDASQLAANGGADGAGFLFRIVQPGGLTTECALAPVPDKACEFVTGLDVRQVRINLQYERALGTTRARGTLQISSVRLEFAP